MSGNPALTVENGADGYLQNNERSTLLNRRHFSCIRNAALVTSLVIIPAAVYITMLSVSAGETILSSGNDQISCDVLDVLGQKNASAFWPNMTATPHWFISNLTQACDYLRYQIKNDNPNVSPPCQSQLFSPKSPTTLPSPLSSVFPELFFFCSDAILNKTESFIILSAAYIMPTLLVLLWIFHKATHTNRSNRNDDALYTATMLALTV